MAQEKKLKITLVRSPIGYNRNQAKITEALGLRKLNHSVVLPDNASVRGSIAHVAHLVKVEEI